MNATATVTALAPYTLVDDGEVQWYCETPQLIRALADLYYVAPGTALGSVMTEPETDDPDNEPAGSYSDLCSRSRVERVDENMIPDGTPIEEMEYAPSRHGWDLTDALASAVRAACNNDDGFAAGNRVKGGEGEDHDHGTIVGVNASWALVAWDSGAQCMTATANLTDETRSERPAHSGGTSDCDECAANDNNEADAS